MKAPTTLTEATEMAIVLMRDDPVNFKKGYTLENACLAIEAVFGFNAQAIKNELELQWLRQRGRL